MCFNSEINTSHLSPRSYIFISAVTIETFSALLEFDGLMNCMLTSHRPDGKKWWKTEKRRVKWKTLQLQELVWLESHFTASSETGGRGDGSLLQTPEHRHGEDTKLSSRNRKKRLGFQLQVAPSAFTVRWGRLFVWGTPHLRRLEKGINCHHGNWETHCPSPTRLQWSLRSESSAGFSCLSQLFQNATFLLVEWTTWIVPFILFNFCQML